MKHRLLYVLLAALLLVALIDPTDAMAGQGPVRIHCWFPTPYTHLNAIVWVERSKPSIAEAERVGPTLKAKAAGDRVLIIGHALANAFDLSDPVKFYGNGPFIESDLAWARAFFGRLEQLGASVDLLVFDVEKGATLFNVMNVAGTGRAGIPPIIERLYADASSQGRLPASVTKFAPNQYFESGWQTAYDAFNAWAHERYYLRAFRDAYLTPARDALGTHVLASEYDTGLFGDFRQPGGEWPYINGTVGGVSSPEMYLHPHTALPTLNARRDFRLARLKACVEASKAAGVDVIPWISSVSFDIAAEQAGSKNPYTLDPMYGVDYVQKMIDLGVREFLYWNPGPPYRDEKTILRDDAMMAVIAEMN